MWWKCVTAGVAVGEWAGWGVRATRRCFCCSRRGWSAAVSPHLSRPEAPGAGRWRPPPHEAPPQGAAHRAREAPEGAEEGREEGQKEVNLPPPTPRAICDASSAPMCLEAVALETRSRVCRSRIDRAGSLHRILATFPFSFKPFAFYLSSYWRIYLSAESTRT